MWWVCIIHDHQNAQHQIACVVRQHRLDGGLALGGVLVADVSLVDVAPDVDADRDDQKAQDEGHAPPPGIQRVFRQHRGQQQAR
ncbi:hypothetical protein G6F62_015342 [Rhizopus arrhizus]|nr:hypothetical protein G6F62_015342 [Rhizopus arrhizus]